MLQNRSFAWIYSIAILMLLSLSLFYLHLFVDQTMVAHLWQLKEFLVFITVGFLSIALTWITPWRGRIILSYALLAIFMAIALNSNFAGVIGVILLTLIFSMGITGSFIYEKVFHIQLPWWLGLTLNLFFVYNLSLILGLIGYFTVTPFIVIFCLNAGVSAMALIQKPKDYFFALPRVFKKCSRTSTGLSLIAIFFLLASFIGSYLPELHFDSQRYYIQFMEHLTQTAKLEANHYSFMELAYWPIQTLASIGYLFCGEFGGKLISGWLFYLLLFIAIVKILMDSHVRLDFALFAGILMLSSPIYFYHAQGAYVDIAYSFVLVAAVYCVRESLLTSAQFIPATFILVGFSFLVKPFSAFYFVFIIFFLAFFWKEKMFALIKNHKQLFIIGFITMCVFIMPRILTTTLWTGNPLFPLLANRFDSRFAGLKATFLPGVNFYYFPHHLSIDLMLFPYISVFLTQNKFADSPMEHLNLFFTLMSILFIFLSLTIKKTISKDILFYLFCSFGGIIAISVLHAPYMRYWYPSIILLFIVLFQWGDRSVFTNLNSSEKKLSLIAMNSSLFISLLFTVPIYFNELHQFGRWMPIQYYRSEIQKTQISQLFTSELAEFFENNNTESTAIAATGFYANNFIKGHVYDSVPWWDTYNKMSTYEEVKKFVSEKQIKYWVMTKDPHWYDVYQKKFPSSFFEKTTWAYETQTHFVVDMEKLQWK